MTILNPMCEVLFAMYVAENVIYIVTDTEIKW